MPFEAGKPRPENAGRKPGSKNKDYQEIVAMAEELGVCPMRIKLLLAKGDYKALGYSDADIAALEPQYRIDTQGKNANDVLPYFHGKRAPISSDGKDADLLTKETLEAILSK